MVKRNGIRDAAGTSLMIVLGIVLYGTIALLPLFLQTLMGYPAVESGLAVSPRGFGAVTSMLIVGRLINRVSGRYLVMFGFTVLAYSIYLFSKINLEISISSIVYPNIISGFAMGFIFVPLQALALATISTERLGNATAAYNLVRNIGGSVGIALFTTLLARHSQTRIRFRRLWDFNFWFHVPPSIRADMPGDAEQVAARRCGGQAAIHLPHQTQEGFLEQVFRGLDRTVPAAKITGQGFPAFEI